MSPIEQILLSEPDETIVLVSSVDLDLDNDNEVNLDEGEAFFIETEVLTESGTEISGTAFGGSRDFADSVGFSVQDRVDASLARADSLLADSGASTSFTSFDFFI